MKNKNLIIVLRILQYILQFIENGSIDKFSHSWPSIIDDHFFGIAIVSSKNTEFFRILRHSKSQIYQQTNITEMLWFTSFFFSRSTVLYSEIIFF